MPFIQKYGINPVSGAPLTIKGLIKLSYFKNDAGACAATRETLWRGVTREA